MRRNLMLALALGGLIMGTVTVKAQETPSSETIERRLEAAPQVTIAKEKKVTRKDIKRRYDLRKLAPAIDIQAINFGFDKAVIPVRERWKVERIATALKRILKRRPREVFLIEGHTDAVGSRQYNQGLSEQRAYALYSDLVRYFGVPAFALEWVGYGEDFLLVPTPDKEWRNRRVTIRRVTDFLR
jgi:outer membrane protein OmpA-like peptidoglycan-associated protein